ncbi:succinate dehydrogenase assembly factor 3, mitochondrial-like [Gigantopelta aegis]|uniref:succinate dehydrogenase assembly factor 3, mitochondrial-like n=1 Tax=Gigantopelta aegis TaxID=1735272 RepID=UPI001B888004|nr:succinate dehydrogenase assembly factor 3, mitochondrial-like [Gigantopelta aegis]
MASEFTHVQRVRALYKALLKLHRGLPAPMKALGDQYLKAEFRTHAKVAPAEADAFLSEWTKYYVTLAKQLGSKKKTQQIGEHLSPQLIDNFHDEQLGQLYELHKETTKPIVEKS